MSRLALMSATVFLFTVGLWVGCTRSSIPLPETLYIEVTGNEFEWNVRYAGPDETFRTEDDYVTKRNITLMAGTPTRIALQSNDYVYSFGLPHLGLKEIAVPDLNFSLEFKPDALGEFILLGDQLCGYQHPDLIGKVNVLAPEEFLEWREAMTSEQEGRQHE